jgi:polysaccharide pyruvyl transferase CsaB
VRILVSGYYGFGNVGDEAVLGAMVEGFRQDLPESEITVLSAAPRLTAELNQVGSVSRFDLPGILREMRKSDVVVSGGGSLFQDATSNRSFLYYIGIVWLAKLLRKKVMVFAQGFGPLRKRFNRWLARLVLNRVDLITLRDEDSLAELGKIGVKRPPVRVTGDPTALLEVEDKSEGRKILGLEGIPLNKPLIGVSVRSIPHPPRSEEQCFKLLAEKLDSLSVDHGFLPVFLLFQCPEDMRQASRVMGLMKEKSYAVFRICRPEEMLALFSQFELVVGMRLHSLIFAAMSGVPMLGLSYDPKVEAFMRFVGQPFVRINSPHLSVGNIISQQLEEILSRKESIRKDLESKKGMLREKAQLNFDLFFEKFGKGK